MVPRHGRRPQPLRNGRLDQPLPGAINVTFFDSHVEWYDKKQQATYDSAGAVTAAGRVASCMGCHEASATHERLYGVQTGPTQ